MDTQKEYSCLERNNKIYSKNIDNEAEYQEALPAYCDDIYRVVKCTSHSYITSADISFNEVKVYGKTEMCLTYYNENSCLCFADFEEEFSKTVTLENLSDSAFANALISDKYTNFRVINQRRIDIHTADTIHLSVYDRIKCPCLSSCSNSKLKKENIKTAGIINTSVTKIEFDEEFSTPADSKPIKRIISSSSFATLSETKIIKDKVLIKALVSVTVLYTSDDGDEDILKAQYSFNVSKIADIAGVDDGDIAIVNINVGNLFLKAKSASNDKLCVIEVFGDLSVNSLFIRENESDIVTDGYVLGRESECTYTDYNCAVNGRSINDSKMVNLSLDFSSEISEIKELGVSLSNASFKNGKIISKADVTIIGATDGGSLTSMSASADIAIDAPDSKNAVAALSINSYDFTMSAAGKVEVRLSLNINAYLYDNKNFKLLSDITAGDTELDYPALTVYFGKENESVWNIAKSFSSDIDLIQKENAITNDTLDSNRVLIIPKV